MSIFNQIKIYQMKKQFILFLFTIFQISIYAQSSIQWQKCLGGTIGEYGSSIQQTIDGGYILAGNASSNDGDVSGNHGGGDVWVVKLDSIGNIQWQKCLGGSLLDNAYSVQQTTDGDYILLGWANSNDGDVIGSLGLGDFWVLKLDSAGVILWQKCLGGTIYDIPSYLEITADGGFIISGQTYSNDGDVSGNHGSSDAWVVKLDNIGTIQWQKCLGGTYDEIAYSIQQTNDGEYIVSGVTSSNDGDVSGNHGNGDAWLVKLDSAGNIQWQKCLGGSSGDEARSVQQTTNGDYILIGTTTSDDGDVSGNHGYSDVWVVKLDSVGAIQWQKCIGGTNSEVAYQIQITTDGGNIFAGFTYSNDGDIAGNHGGGGPDMLVVKIDSVGAIQWQKCLGGFSNEGANSIQNTNDGQYILTGWAVSNDGDVIGNHGEADIWVVKLSATVGMNELSSITSLNTYPNPASDNLTVNLSLSKTENLTLQLINVLGQTVLEPICLKNSSGTFTHSISTSKLPNGIYLLDIMGEEGRRTEKIVIDHR